MISLSRLTSKYVGQEYELGQVDCFSIVVSYLRDMGVVMPDAFEGLTMESYSALYLENPLKAKDVMLRYMATYTKEIPIEQAFAGDVLFAQLKKVKCLPALVIDGGNGTVVAVSEGQGVSVIPKKYYNVLRVFRCLR